jgi:hypothetical protein
MKILKYLLLLFLLFFISILVFVNTEDSFKEIKNTTFVENKSNFTVRFFLKKQFWTTEDLKIYRKTFDNTFRLDLMLDEDKYQTEIQFSDSLNGTYVKWKATEKLDFMSRFEKLFFEENRESKFLEKQLQQFKDSLITKSNFYSFKIEGLRQLPEGIVIEKDSLISENYLPIGKQKLLNQLELLALKNDLKIQKKPLFFYEKQGQNVRLKVQNLVSFDSLTIDSIPDYFSKRPKQLVLQMKVQGKFKGLKHHQKEIQKQLDTLNLNVISFDFYIENEKKINQNSSFEFENRTELFLPVTKKE